MIVSHLIEAVLISVLGLLLRWENKKRNRIQSQMEGGLEGRDLDSTAFLDLTDRENLKCVSCLFFGWLGKLTLHPLVSGISIESWLPLLDIIYTGIDHMFRHTVVCLCDVVHIFHINIVLLRCSGYFVFVGFRFRVHFVRAQSSASLLALVVAFDPPVMIRISPCSSVPFSIPMPFLIRAFFEILGVSQSYLDNYFRTMCLHSTKVQLIV